MWKPYSCAEECSLSRELGAKIKPQHSKFPVSQARATTTSNRWHFRHTGSLRALKASPFPQLFPFTYALRPFVPRPLSPGWLTAHPHFCTFGCCFDTGSCYAAALAFNSPILLLSPECWDDTGRALGSSRLPTVFISSKTSQRHHTLGQYHILNLPAYSITARLRPM